jgi:hypothetical protein
MLECLVLTAEKREGRLLEVLSGINRSIVVVKADVLCLVHALIIAMARVNGDPKYVSYADVRCFKES